MVQVIGIGYGGTGTESLREALDLLGYKTFHTKTMFLDRPELLHTWYQNTTTSMSKDPKDYCPLHLSKFLDGYTAATSMLFSVCLEQTLEEFPDAYYILTQRTSSQDWFVTWTTVMDSMSLLPQYTPWLPRVKQIDYYHRWLLSYIHDQDSSFFTQSHPLKQDSVLAQESYRQHLAKAKQMIPSHQLLELPLGSGWDPLTGFLNVSVTPAGIEYPHRGTSDQVMHQCRCVVLVANVLLFVVVSILPKLIGKLTQNRFRQDTNIKTDQGDDETKQNEQDNQEVDDDDDDDYLPTVKILDDDSEPSPLVSMPQMQQLAAKVLPPIVALRGWKRIYRLSRDGDDFGTFLQATHGHAQTLILVQTTHQQQILGAFADSLWDASERENYNINVGGSGFYGSTQACLFAFEHAKEDGTVVALKVYKWSGLNRYIQLFDTSKGRVAFGGGGGSDGKEGFGLCIKDNFSRGTSSACETFNMDEPLTGSDEQFAILDVEIWAFARGTLG